MKHTKLATTLLALAAGALAIGSAAYADGWFKELDKPKAVTLGV